MRIFLLIGLGGLLGANARYFVSTYVADRWGMAFPYGTLAVNVTGSFAIGVFLTLVTTRVVESADARTLVVTGFLGAYTTFSTFAFETVALVGLRDRRRALLNALGSVALCLGAVVAGILLVHLFVGKAA